MCGEERPMCTVNIYLFSLSTQVDSAIAVVQEDSSTVRLDKEILANAIPMMYIFPQTKTIIHVLHCTFVCQSLWICV